MKQTKKERMYQNIERHGDNLNKIFNTEYDNITLCKKLHKLERQAHKVATDYCNGDIDTEAWDSIADNIYDKLCKILGDKASDYCFLNGDCRGYALKIHDDIVRDNNYIIYRDWGGYGILSPDFNE
jgi:hypothetical protein